MPPGFCKLPTVCRLVRRYAAWGCSGKALARMFCSKTNPTPRAGCSGRPICTNPLLFWRRECGALILRVPAGVSSRQGGNNSHHDDKPKFPAEELIRGTTGPWQGKKRNHQKRQHPNIGT